MTYPSIPFPQIGSLARCAGLVWTIHQRSADGSFLLLRAGYNRRATIDELDDPALDGLNIDGLDDRGVRQLVWLRDILRTGNTIVFTSLRGDMQAAARQGDVPTADGPALAGLLRRLGWEKVRNTGTMRGVNRELHPGALSIWARVRPVQVAA